MNQSQRYDPNNKKKYPEGMIHPGDRELKDGWQFWIHENEAIDLGNFKISDQRNNSLQNNGRPSINIDSTGALLTLSLSIYTEFLM